MMLVTKTTTQRQLETNTVRQANENLSNQKTMKTPNQGGRETPKLRQGGVWGRGEDSPFCCKQPQSR